VKAGVFSHDGKILAFSRRAFEPTVSKAGHIDISIDVIYESARESVREVVKKCGMKIAAMSISSQGETFVTLDKDDHPLHDAIIWYDSRAGRQAEELRDAVRSAVGRVPGIDAIMTVSKIRWLQQNRPEIARQARRYLLLPDYFAYRLTGLEEGETNPGGRIFVKCQTGRRNFVVVTKSDSKRKRDEDDEQNSENGLFHGRILS